jgi:hypothetical protein
LFYAQNHHEQISWGYFREASPLGRYLRFLLAAVPFWPTLYRYDKDQLLGGILVRTNRLTGLTAILWGGKVLDIWKHFSRRKGCVYCFPGINRGP